MKRDEKKFAINNNTINNCIYPRSRLFCIFFWIRSRQTKYIRTKFNYAYHPHYWNTTRLQRYISLRFLNRHWFARRLQSLRHVGSHLPNNNGHTTWRQKKNVVHCRNLSLNLMNNLLHHTNNMDWSLARF